MGRQYENNDIFLKLRACRPTLLLLVLLALAACWATTVTWWP